MIIKKLYQKQAKSPSGLYTMTTDKEGWFLFGFIPLYIRDTKITWH